MREVEDKKVDNELNEEQKLFKEEVDRYDAAHKEPYVLGNVFGTVNGLQAMQGMFPEFSQRIDELTKKNAFVKTGIEAIGKPYKHGWGIDNATEEIHLISDPDEKRQLTEILVEAKQLAKEIKEHCAKKAANDKETGKYFDKDSTRGKAIDIIANQIDLALSGDLELVQQLDGQFASSFSSTFMTFPTDMFSDGVKNENGRYDYQRDMQRYEEMMARLPFLKQQEDSRDFAMNVALPYAKKKAAGSLTEKDVEEYNAKLSEYHNKQVNYFNDIRENAPTDKDFSKNDVALNNGTPKTVTETNWHERFGRVVLERIVIENEMRLNGWPAEDRPLFMALNQMERSVNKLAAGAFSNAAEEDVAKAREIQKGMKESFKKLFTTKIKTPEERMELINAVTPFVEEYNKLYPKVGMSPHRNWIQMDIPAKRAVEEAKAREVKPFEIGKEIEIKTDRPEVLEGVKRTQERKHIESVHVQAFSDSFRIDRMNKIYESLPSMEEKLDFLFDSMVFANANEGNRDNWKSKENSNLEKLYDSFSNTYIKNGNQRIHQRIFEKLGKYSAEISMQIKKDVDKILESDPAIKADAQTGQKKAYIIARDGINANKLSTLNRLKMYIANDYSAAPNVNREKSKSFKIDENTTWDQYAEMMGFTDPVAKEKFIKDKKATPDKKLIQGLKEEAEINVEKQNKELEEAAEKARQAGNNIKVSKIKAPSTKDIIGNIKEGLFKNRYNVLWADKSSEKVFKESGLSDEEIKAVNDISTRNSQELSFRGIDKDWVKNDYPKYSNSAHAEASATDTKDYIEKYIVGFNNSVPRFEAENKLVEDAKKREGLSVEEKYSELFTFDKEVGDFEVSKISAERGKEICHDVHADVLDDFNKMISAQSKMMEVEKYGDIYKNAVGATRVPTVNNIFELWALGTHPEIEINDILHLEDDPALLEEFRTFCKDNVTQEPIDAESYRKAVNNWADVFSKATEKVKQFKLPNIDYSDPAKVKESAAMLGKIRGLIIDYSQQKDDIFHIRHGIEGKNAAREHLGTKAYNGMQDFWGDLQSLFAPFNDGYITAGSLKKGGQTTGIAGRIAGIAASRALFADQFGGAAGKTLDDALKGFDKKKYYYNALATNISSSMTDETGLQSKEYKDIVPISTKEFIDYLEGTNTEAFIEKIRTIEQTLTPLYKKDEMLRQNGKDATSFRRDVAFGSAFDKIKNMPDDPDSVINFVNSEELITGVDKDNDLKPSELINVNLKRLFSENFTHIVEGAGLTKGDILTVNGKSANELFGKKYDHLNPEMKDRCLAVEYLKALANGKSTLGFKNVYVGENSEPTVTEPVTLLMPEEDMKELKNSYRIFKAGKEQIKEQLVKFQNDLLTTHGTENAAEARQEIGQIGSDLFRDMERTLNRAIKGLDNDDLTIKQIETRLSDYQKAAAKYNKERRNLVFNKRTPEGETRFRVSEESTNAMTDILVTYQDLTRNLKTDLHVNDNYTLKDSTLGKMDNLIENTLSKKGISQALNTDKVTLTNDQAKSYAESVAEVAHAKVQYNAELVKGLKTMGKSYTKLKEGIKKAKSPDPYEAAVYYLASGPKDDVAKGNYSVGYINTLQRDLAERFNSGAFKKEAEKLSKNPVFRATLKQNKAGYRKEWADIQKKADAEINSMQTNLNDLLDPEKDVARYVMTGSMDGRKFEVVDKEVAVDKMYNRLADIVAMQILTEPSSRVIVEAMASGRMEYADIFNNTKATLKSKKVLGGKKFDVGAFREKITSGELRTMATESAIKQAGRNATERLPIARKDEPLKDVQGPKLGR